MKDRNLYSPLWQKYQQIIAIQMKNALNGPKEVKIFKHEFEALGKRPLSDYVFNLEIDGSKVSNNINGSAIARDLYDSIKLNSNAFALISSHNYKFSMGKELVLNISTLPAEPVEV